MSLKKNNIDRLYYSGLGKTSDNTNFFFKKKKKIGPFPNFLSKKNYDLENVYKRINTGK